MRNPNPYEDGVDVNYLMKGKTMSERLDIFHPEVVEAFAAAWASIDGKLEKFEAEKALPKDYPQAQIAGHYDSYMFEAAELLSRAAKRLPNMDLWERLGHF